MNVISFSLYGDNPKYHNGIIENINLAKDIYPGWKVWVHYAFIEKVIKIQDCEMIACSPSKSHKGLFWRFYPMFDKNIDRMIVRDADSRINWREKAAVDEWINSKKPFHIMRDHVDHTAPIMGGMWGCVPKNTPDFSSNFTQWSDFEMDGDQKFLRNHVWSWAKNHSMIHDSHPDLAIKYHGPHEIHPFPYHNKTEVNFVGEQC